MEPPFLATELRKLLLWLTLECFRRNSFENRSGRAGSWSQKRSKWAWFRRKVGVASKILTPPLLEILDPPLSRVGFDTPSSVPMVFQCVARGRSFMNASFSLGFPPEHTQ